MTQVTCFAPAKINLTLHVTGQRADGYHLLDSMVVFADAGDQITFDPAPAMSIGVTGPFAKGVPVDARNLLWKAAALAGVTGHITVVKNLPHGAGIGGGSSDAGALLRALGSRDSGLTLGADVPVCRIARAARMSGIGEQVVPLETVPELHAVLVNPGVHLPTPQVFKKLTQKTNAPMPSVLPTWGAARDLRTWLSTQRNDLQAPAMAQAHEIAEVINVLSKEDGQELVRMSGSGATCFALFNDAQRAGNAAARILAEHPAWWVKACVLS